MQIPDFSDFAATLTSETLSVIFKDANRAMELTADNPNINQDDLPGLQLLSGAYQIALELIGAYHVWLQQELQ